MNTWTLVNALLVSTAFIKLRTTVNFKLFDKLSKSDGFKEADKRDRVWILFANDARPDELNAFVAYVWS